MATYRTGQRARLCEYLSLNSARSLPLDEISRALLPDGKGKSTLYRLLAELEAEGRVRRVFDDGKRRFLYQYICGEACASHLHLQCRACGKVVHLEDEVTRTFGDRLMRSLHFTLDGDTVLFGLCEKCASRALLTGHRNRKKEEDHA